MIYNKIIWQDLILQLSCFASVTGRWVFAFDILIQGLLQAVSGYKNSLGNSPISLDIMILYYIIKL